MIIDTSAIVSIFRLEPETDLFLGAIESAVEPRISVASYLECMMVLDRLRDPVLSRKLDEFLEVSKIIVEPVTKEQASIARRAWRDYGKGSGHPAQLNYGDLFAYALAAQRREALLYKGTDFAHTDVKSAI